MDATLAARFNGNLNRDDAPVSPVREAYVP
jgi:hypothetical protein